MFVPFQNGPSSKKAGKTEKGKNKRRKASRVASSHIKIQKRWRIKMRMEIEVFLVSRDWKSDKKIFELKNYDLNWLKLQSANRRYSTQGHTMGSKKLAQRSKKFSSVSFVFRIFALRTNQNVLLSRVTVFACTV
jgi:hypothetical protein